MLAGAIAAAQAGQPPVSVWNASALPAAVDSGDTNAVELGMRFRSSVPGRVLGVRYYKSAANTGAHTGQLWSATGELLGRARFDAETETGWQLTRFDTPVTIAARTPYVVSYHAPRGRYAVSSGYFSSEDYVSGPLTALRNSDGIGGGNGLYRYSASSAFPEESYQSSNYWVDVLFEPADPDREPPSIPAGLAATPTGDTRLTLYWDASSDNYWVEHYDIERDGQALAQTEGLYYHDATAQAGATYTYRVRAVDAAGYRSAYSEPVVVKFQPSNESPGPILPGTVGFRGNERALKRVDGPRTDDGRNVPPAGCRWEPAEYGLVCDGGDVVIDGYLILGGVDHAGSGTLTVSRSVIEGQRKFKGIYLQKGTHCGATVTDTTLRWGGATPPPGGDGAIKDAGGCRVTLKRNDISGWADGINVGAGGVIEDNDIHDLYLGEGAHNDGIQFFGGSDYRIAGNHISIGWGGPGSTQNGAVFLGGDSGLARTVVIRNNYLSGGGYILRVKGARDVIVTDNVFGPMPGQHGDYDISPGTIRQWQDNRRADGTPVRYP